MKGTATIIDLQKILNAIKIGYSIVINCARSSD